MKRADNIAATDSAINYAVSTVSLIHVYCILFSSRGQDVFIEAYRLSEYTMQRWDRWHRCQQGGSSAYKCGSTHHIWF